VRRPGGGLVYAGLGDTCVNNTLPLKIVETYDGPKRRQADALQGVDRDYHTNLDFGC
jgi:hypothetical protein